MPNGSPFEVDKFDQRLELARRARRECGLPLVYLNQVGGQDELVFDGGSFVVNADGSLAHVLPFWRESLAITRVAARTARRCRCDGHAAWTAEPRLSAIYNAMMLGLRDYVHKNGFRGIVLGLSGGIDSALTAVVAVDALGADRVRGVRLPSKFTTDAEHGRRRGDGARCSACRLETVAIEDAVDALRSRRSRRCSPGGRATSPRRTSRRAPAACC